MVAQENKDASSKEMKNKKVEEIKKEEVKVDSKETKEKAETKTVKKKEVVKKDLAIANGYSMKISPKQSKYICRLLKGKSPESAVNRLQAVIDERRPVPMAGLEVAHKKGKGLAGAKFPKNASKEIMAIGKQVGANAVVAGIEEPIIIIAKSNQASAPYRRSGRKAKRTHIYIEVREKKWFLENKSKKGNKR